MVAGYTGTNKRATYTCIGDTVNLAARLESHTKVAQRLFEVTTICTLANRVATSHHPWVSRAVIDLSS
jgi:class 3 adenylate cyclase